MCIITGTMREGADVRTARRPLSLWMVNALSFVGALSLVAGMLYAGYVALRGWAMRQDQFLAASAVAPLAVPTMTATATPPPTPTPVPTLTPTATPSPTPTTTPTPTSTPTPTPPPKPIQINIPAIGVKSSIVSVPLVADTATGVAEWDVDLLFRQGRQDVVGHLDGTSLPGQPGNAVLSGHNYGFGWNGVFVNLGLLKAGDRVTVVNEAAAQLIYEVVSIQRVPWRRRTVDELARHLEYLGPTSDERLTLASCSGANFGPFPERIYVVAKPVR